MSSRLESHLGFLIEIDRLKDVLRRSLTTQSRRPENSAEHSWHLAIMAIILSEHRNGPTLDLLRVLKMVLIHDLVEIDAGDTFCYDRAGNESKAEREQRAADRIFKLLPSDQAHELRILWDEFEQGLTEEARFAHGIDRLHPILQNLHTGGGSWREYGILKKQVVERNQQVAQALPDVWDEILQRLDQAESDGFFG